MWRYITRLCLLLHYSIFGGNCDNCLNPTYMYAHYSKRHSTYLFTYASCSSVLLIFRFAIIAAFRFFFWIHVGQLNCLSSLSSLWRLRHQHCILAEIIDWVDVLSLFCYTVAPLPIVSVYYWLFYARSVNLVHGLL